jgi:hypothetical protein
VLLKEKVKERICFSNDANRCEIGESFCVNNNNYSCSVLFHNYRRELVNSLYSMKVTGASVSRK